jgi:hypothetical protein
LLALGTSAVAGEDPPLPSDVNVVSPAADLAPKSSGYSGRWTGMWIGAGDRLNHILIIENVSADAFSAIYSVGDSLTNEGRTKAGWRRIQGTVLEGKLMAKLGANNVEYVMQSDGTLAGTFTNARGFSSKATMKKSS